MRNWMMTTLAVVFASACSATLSAPTLGAARTAVPQTQAQSLTGIRQAFRASYTDTFQKADLNKDGFLDPTESHMPVEMFRAIDKDHDGKLSLKEHVTWMMRANGDFIKGFQQMALDAMHRFDADQNGVLEYSEYRTVIAPYDAAIQQKYLWAFKGSDHDHDARLDLSELEDFLAWDYVMMSMITPPTPYPGSAYPAPPTVSASPVPPPTPGPVEPTAPPTATPRPVSL